MRISKDNETSNWYAQTGRWTGGEAHSTEAALVCAFSLRRLEWSLNTETPANQDHIICSVETQSIQENEPRQICSRRISCISLRILRFPLHKANCPVNCWTLWCAKSPVRLNKHQASGHRGGGSHVKQTLRHTHTHTSLYYQKTLYAVGAKCAHYIPTCYLTVVVSLLSPGFGLQCVCLRAMYFLAGPSVSPFHFSQRGCSEIHFSKSLWPLPT